MSTVTATEARTTLPDLLDRVQAGEEVTITRHGQPVAVVVRPDALRSRRTERVFAEAAAIHDRLEAARHQPVSIKGGYTVEQAEEHVAEIRAGRDRRPG